MPESRRKGLKGEREVAAAFEGAGWTVRGLESAGDWLVFHPPRYYDMSDTYSPENTGTTLHLEVKRAERVRVPEWLRQAQSEAPPGVPAVLVIRQNRGEWLACLPLADLLELIP